MGLDVYLYRYKNFASTTEREARYNDESERIWEEVGGGVGYANMTDEQKERARSQASAFAATLELDEWGDDKKDKQCVEIPSAKHPDHLFKIGYFRSSYNSSGIDRILSDRIGVTLDDIMGADDRYTFQPDWEASRDRAVQALADFRAVLDRDGRFKVMTESVNPFGRHPDVAEITNEAQALAVAVAQIRRTKTGPSPFDGGWWSNAQGTYGDKPVKAVALMIGRGFANMPTAYVVYEADDFDWYEQALEIVVETCDYVLAQPDRDLYYLHWSG